MTKKNSTTPMMEQYFRIKENHQDSLLFFRLGDFYEMFYEDAKLASSILEIALTSRQKVPMCGIPYHAADVYLTKLLKNGFKVAVCEQIEDSKDAIGVVKRDVVKVLTPGTAIEMELEEAKESIYISSLYFQEEEWGLARVDLASGQLMATQTDSLVKKNLADELFKVSPKEIIFPEGQEERVDKVLAGNNITSILKSPSEDWVFDFNQAKNFLQNHFQVKSLEGFGLGDRPLAVSVAGALLYYLKKLRKDALSLVHNVSYVQSSQHMILDSSTIKNLELVKNLRDGRTKDSLLDIIDFTVTSMGGRLFRFSLLQPLLNCTDIENRLDTVTELLSHTIERQELQESLKNIFDLERLSGKIALAVANARDLIALKKSLLPLPQIRSLIESFSSMMVAGIREGWDNAHDIVELIVKSILEEPAFLLTEGGIIKEDYNVELDELRKISLSGKTFITQLEDKERKRTGISSLKIRYNKVFGYYIDVTKPNLSRVPPDYIRKQTLVNSERFITPELREYEEKVLNAEQRIGELEFSLFLDVREKISRENSRLKKIASDIAMLDFLVSLAELASQRNYCRPLVGGGEAIQILDGRHPVIEVVSDEPFIPRESVCVAIS